MPPTLFAPDWASPPIISLALAPALALELVLGRVKLSSLGIHDLAGFAQLVAGYVVIVSKPQPQ